MRPEDSAIQRRHKTAATIMPGMFPATAPQIITAYPSVVMIMGLPIMPGVVMVMGSVVAAVIMMMVLFPGPMGVPMAVFMIVFVCVHMLMRMHVGLVCVGMAVFVPVNMLMGMAVIVFVVAFHSSPPLRLRPHPGVCPNIGRLTYLLGVKVKHAGRFSMAEVPLTTPARPFTPSHTIAARSASCTTTMHIAIAVSG